MSSVGLPPHHSFSPFPSVAVSPLPPLPKIRSEQLRRRVFTHRSQPMSHRYNFQAPESDPCDDNEELAHIGDQVVGLAITDLIQSLYPHLRVGPASKVRDQVKRKSVLAEMLHLPATQASNLKASLNVQVDVFKAYVGGVYRDQGLEVVSNWLISLLESHVEAAYQNVRNDYHPSLETAAVPQPPGRPTARDLSLSSSTSPECAGLAFPSHVVEDPHDPRRCIPVHANVPQQGRSWPQDGDVDPRLAVEWADQSARRRRRRRNSGRWDAGERHTFAEALLNMVFDTAWDLILDAPLATFLQRRSLKGSDTTESARKRFKAWDADGE
ncbi:ribonuclease III domain-containing protein [Russula earlei]|uniref:Ribonuclease III domain-containing protein n=1 Tax=Russula earlei TaxID=71964 RepID=A0ACC0UDA4_9AGAM|nr:ribonuclease III domain-containing protein [Russula earlei]